LTKENGMEKFCGKWIQISVTNADELMKAKGIGYMTRKAALLITPTMDISLNQDKSAVRFLSVTKVKTFDVTLSLDGGEFEMEADPGTSMTYTATCHIDDQGNFVIKRSYKDGSGPTEVITRSIDTDGNLVQVNAWGDVVSSTRIWKRV